jgi:hypothetical protein
MPRTFKLVRVFCVAFAVAALLASGVLLFLSDARGAVAAVVVAASAFMLASTARTGFRSPPLTWLGFALLGAGLVILGFPIVTVVSAFAGLFSLQLVVNAVLAHRIGRITFERLDRPTVMAGAEKLLQEFSAEGFTIIGGYRCSILRKPVSLTIMVAPGRDRLAVVTDLVQYVLSRFGTRMLVTGNSGVSPVPPQVLRQVVADGTPADLVRAHEAAVTVLGRESCRPDVFATDDVALEAVRQHEERAIAFIGRASLRNALRMETGRLGGALLSEGADQRHRVDEWMKA